MSDTRIRTAVIGAGKMGSIHAKVYSQLPDCRLVAVMDIEPAKAKELADKYGCEAFSDLADLIGKIDAVTVATPTVTHRQIAEQFVRHRIPVLIEKPLASTVKEGRRIVSLARQFDTVVAVGHSERCNPVAQAIKRLHMDEPKFIEAHRISPYPFRSADVGVVLDVMIHDIDIILSLASGKVKRVDAVGIGVLEGGEDICNARLVFENGCIANVTASRLALKTERKLHVFTRQAYLSVDYLKKSGIIIKAGPNVNVVDWIKQQRQRADFNPASVNWADLLHVEQLEIDDKEPIRLQQEAFLRAVRDRTFSPEVSAEEGLLALRCAERILRAVKRHKWD